MVNTFTTFKFLNNKEVNRRMYYAESHHIKPDPEKQRQGEELTDVFSDQGEEKPLTSRASE
jgi:hypothetical protein